MKGHLKSITVPKTWEVEKKKNTFITRPMPGAHSFEIGLPLNLVLRDLLDIAKTAKEVKYILTYKEVLVDGKRRRDPKYLVGLMDVLSIPELKKNYRAVITRRNKLLFHPISKEEAEFKLCKIINKTIINKKFQINLGDGRNIIHEKNNYRTGDTLVIKLPSQEVVKHLPLKEGCKVYLVAGEHKGAVGTLTGLGGSHSSVSIDGEIFQTPKKYLFVIGEESSLIDVAWAGK